jgi:hypothetical protein
MTPLERVTKRVTRNGHPDTRGTPIPLLTIDEFFEGNDCIGSIGCNLDGQPSPDRFYSLFKTIAARPDVRDIRVQITMFDNPEWPFSDTVFVMTSATDDDVRSWFPEELLPDEIGEAIPFDSRFEPYEIPSGARAIFCWWD